MLATPLIALVLTSSLLACLVLMWRRGLRLRGLGRALLFALEVFGLFSLMWALNLALGLMVVIMQRLAGEFASVYPLADPLLALLSLLQALVIASWLRSRDDALV